MQNFREWLVDEILSEHLLLIFKKTFYVTRVVRSLEPLSKINRPNLLDIENCTENANNMSF